MTPATPAPAPFPPTMRAVVWEHGRLRLDPARPVPVPAAGEALIRVVLAGVCATDRAILNGYGALDGVLGHEFVGVVASAPADPEWVGRRVVGEINLACGACHPCSRGDRNHCVTRRVVGIRHKDGVFAEWLLLPVINLHQVPDGVTDRAALFAEPLAAAAAIPERTHIRPSERVAVVGDGKLGLLVAQVVALTGCEVVVIGRHPAKWRVLADRAIPARDEGAAVGMAGSRDLVVECSGSPSGFELARRLVRPRGRILLKSTLPTPLAVELAGLVTDEITLSGSRCGPFPAALRLLERRLVTVEPLIEAVFPLDEALRALERAGEKGVLKVAIQP